MSGECSERDQLWVRRWAELSKCDHLWVTWCVENIRSVISLHLICRE